MRIFFYILIGALCWACSTETQRSDAYGNFEADVVTVSAETQGKLLKFEVREGEYLKAGKSVAVVDTSLLHLQKLQIEARMASLGKKTVKVEPEIKVLEDQKANLVRERDRVESLLKNKAATRKQLEDIEGELTVIDQRIASARIQARNTNAGILSEKDPLAAQRALIEEQIRKAVIINPIEGRVLNKLSEESEIVGPGAPLYRIAHLDPLVLHAYASSTQIQRLRIGEEVEVLVDEGEEAYKKMKGTISWIASQAEFTPKTIQTKKDRVSLVYGLKVRVSNPEGFLKIGMPGEINFASTPTSQTNP